MSDDKDQRIAELEAELARTKRGARELGRILDRTLRDALDASGRHDAIEEDGDGDWGSVWETLAELRPRAEKAEAEAERLRLKHHEKCFQRRPQGIPADLPEDICDCRILWMLKGAAEAQAHAERISEWGVCSAAETCWPSTPCQSTTTCGTRR